MVKFNISLRQMTIFLAIMAMGLSISAHLSPLWAKTYDGKSIVICTALGLKTITIDQNGQPTKSTSSSEHCSICLINNQTATLQNHIAIPFPVASPKTKKSESPSPLLQTKDFYRSDIRAPPTLI